MVLSLTNMSAFAEGDGLSGIFGGNSDVVKVAVDLDNAKIEYGDQTVTNADKTFVASAGKDLKFKASAVTEDFTLERLLWLQLLKMAMRWYGSRGHRRYVTQSNS